MPSNVEILRIGNPKGVFQIGIGLMRYLSTFLPLLYREIQTLKIDFYVLKYLSYHIPLALKIKFFLIDLIKKQKGVELTFYSYWMDTNAYALALLKIETGNLRYFIRSHNGDLYQERHPHGQIVFSQTVYNHADLIAPISNDGTAYIKNHNPQYSEKTKTFHLGVKEQMLSPIPARLVYRIVSCSSIIPLKRLDKICEVISLLNLKIEWIHMGGKDQEIEALRQKWFQKIPSYITFIPKGQLTHAEIMDFYQSNGCDLFINLSQFEGIPVSMMEAISFGIPLVSNDVGGIREILNEDTGLMVHVDESPEIIASKIQVFLESGNSRSLDFRNKIQAFWAKNFHSEKNYEAFVKEIDQFSTKI